MIEYRPRSPRRKHKMTRVGTTVSGRQDSDLRPLVRDCRRDLAGTSPDGPAERVHVVIAEKRRALVLWSHGLTRNGWRRDAPNAPRLR